MVLNATQKTTYRNEKRGSLFDDHINEFRQLTLRVVTVSLSCVTTNLWQELQTHTSTSNKFKASTSAGNAVLATFWPSGS